MDTETILVVEDDPKIRNLLRNVLEGEGYVVFETDSAQEALDLFRASPVSLVTLDINLGSDNGFELARDIRRTSQVPIIMVTGKDDIIDRVVGLEIGADVYITKPFHVREMIARVRSVLRRAGQGAPSQDASSELRRNGLADESLRFRFDGMTAIPERMELLDRTGSDCALTSGDFKLLTVFLERPKRVLSRDQLMDLTGGHQWNPLDRTVDNQIARLRKKIEHDPSDPKLIKTVRGVGYMFASDVRLLHSSVSSEKSA